MRWFAYQRHPGGAIPVLFAEHPNREWGSCAGVIWVTIKEIPDELRDASVAEVAAYFDSRDIVNDTPTPLEPDWEAACYREAAARKAAEREVHRLKLMIASFGIEV